MIALLHGVHRHSVATSGRIPLLLVEFGKAYLAHPGIDVFEPYPAVFIEDPLMLQSVGQRYAIAGAGDGLVVLVDEPYFDPGLLDRRGRSAGTLLVRNRLDAGKRRGVGVLSLTRATARNASGTGTAAGEAKRSQFHQARGFVQDLLIRPS